MKEQVIKGWAVVYDTALVGGRKMENYVSSIHRTRQEAREEKDFCGGKAEGVRIVKLEGNKEIR